MFSSSSALVLFFDASSGSSENCRTRSRPSKYFSSFQARLLQYFIASAIPIAVGNIQSSCDTQAVDRCLTGVLFSAQHNRTFFWKDVADVENLCRQVPRIPQCIKSATTNCPEAAKKFLKALMKGYEVVLQSQICKDSPEGVRRRENFASSSNCLRQKFDNGCMRSYIGTLDNIVALPSGVNKVRKACCLHRSYRVCLADQVTPLCGVEAASRYIQFNSMLSAAPIREVCGTAYADDSCADIPLEQQPKMSPIAGNPDNESFNGTILSRLLKILTDTEHFEQPTTNFNLDEALG
ncbi:hypothetical protein BIW11_05986 [Tropilaelaps mercedesae]|uniref:Uncharacterized protein n=1 Tax=Tropilaelaps mercedesae TaxID=418985 RepID=A0A1V9Y016_9ACAR|nr:hypothetical protein BIW11_05986 [Tropilaelaps mercedesae]